MRRMRFLSSMLTVTLPTRGTYLTPGTCLCVFVLVCASERERAFAHACETVCVYARARVVR